MDDDIQINTISITKKIAKKVDKKVLKRKTNNDDDDDENGGFKSIKKFKSTTISEQDNKTTGKFSSLFKNNANIPVIKKTSADFSIKEDLFSSNKFSSLNLHPHMIDCLNKRFNLETMTQIQEKTIPVILNKSDCFVKSMTGSGKTLAYAIPIIQLLQEKMPAIKRNDGIFALILVPTRELAIQISDVFELLCKSFIRIVAGALIGGMKKKSEKNRIRKGLNILIATPGRLCDHLDTTMCLDLAKIEYLVFDEADRMLDMDFEKKINFIIFKINDKRKELELPKPQIILISATLTNGVREIARRLNVNDAVNIDESVTSDQLADNQSQNDQDQQIALPAGLKNFFIIVPSKIRLVGLISFILNKFVYKTKRDEMKKMIIFASTNDSVEFHEIVLRIFLNHKFSLYFDDELSGNNGGNSIPIEVFKLYGNLNQNERTETLNKFRKAQTGVLLCTDVLARGLDLPDIDWVIQYNTPGTCFDYVHRVGRTARAGSIGNALIFLEPCEVEYINELNKYGISLKEIKLNNVMDCLNQEANFYPKQVNSDRLIIAKNAEECANSMQFYIEEYVDKHSEVESLARKAYLSSLRSYSTYSKEYKKIFHLKNIHLGHAAKSFGLREAPNEIAQNGSQYRNSYSNNKEKNSFSQKSFSNNKETKSFSQKSFDQSGYSGLLRNHKTVDEFGAGFDTSKKLPKKLKLANGNRKQSRLSLADRLKMSTKPSIKINKKRDMSVFDD